MSEHPVFESLEGLRGTGKSTIAPMLAIVRDAVLVPTIPTYYAQLREDIDQRDDVEARMCFYLSALFSAAEQIQRCLDAGLSVVVESYFARCVATHQAMGARLRVALPSGLPQPTAYQLVCSADERQRRLGRRTKPISRWDALEEAAADRIMDAYLRFPMRTVDTTGLAPDQVVEAILHA